VGLGLISFADVPRLVKFQGVYTPDPKHRAVYDDRFGVYKQIYKQMKGVYKHLNS
jgi:xylulokinase